MKPSFTSSKQSLREARKGVPPHLNRFRRAPPQSHHSRIHPLCPRPRPRRLRWPGCRPRHRRSAAEGKFFSNGLDLAWARVSPSDRTPQLGSALRATIAELISLPMPTIAAVTGHAAAGGFIFARAHDYVVMRGDRGFIYMSELDIGVPIARYAMSVLRSRISDARGLRDLLLRSEKMKAGEAERKGVIDRAVEGGAEEVVAVAMRMGEEMAARGWDGGVYASIRKGAFPEAFRDLGLEETDEDISRVFISKI